jgi:hypothetical protein
MNCPVAYELRQRWNLAHRKGPFKLKPNRNFVGHGELLMVSQAKQGTENYRARHRIHFSASHQNPNPAISSILSIVFAFTSVRIP